ncbi:ECF RNA polymerase sigma factor SigK [compost metagenome]
MNEQLSDLLSRCALGDRSAFAHLYELISPKLYGVALRLLKQRPHADDVLQEAFTRIWYRAGSYQSDLGNPMTWMTAIVRNHALDVLAAQGRHERLLDRDADYGDIEIAEADNDPEADTLLCDAAGRLGICLEQLRDQHRQCIAMIYWDGITYQQLADKLKKPTGTVKVWVRRGLEKLRQCLEQ